MSVKTFLQHLGQDIHDLVVKLFGANAPAQLEALAATIFRADVLPIFQKAIEDGMNTSGSGAQKLELAASEIGPALEKLGVSLGKSAINWGIETVLQLVKAKAPAA